MLQRAHGGGAARHRGRRHGTGEMPPMRCSQPGGGPEIEVGTWQGADALECGHGPETGASAASGRRSSQAVGAKKGAAHWRELFRHTCRIVPRRPGVQAEKQGGDASTTCTTSIDCSPRPMAGLPESYFGLFKDLSKAIQSMKRIEKH